MKRYYLSKIKQVEMPGMGMVNRHRLQEFPNVEYVGGEIAVDPATGMPTQKALLVLVASKEHAKFVDDPEMVALPQVALDTKVSAIHTPTKQKCKTELQALGFAKDEVDEVFDNADGLRDVVEHFGRKNNPTFRADDFDVNES
jgi:hypothetical protein